MNTIVNQSGLQPLGRAVLVRMTQLDDMLAKSSLLIPDSVRQSTAVMDDQAEVIEIGPECWKDEGTPRCVPGDRVIVTKFAGYVTSGRDGIVYRLVNDRDVFCKIGVQ